MNAIEELVKVNGFDSLEEFNKMVASVDISTPVRYADFVRWQRDDGSKEGLLKLPKKEMPQWKSQY